MPQLQETGVVACFYTKNLCKKFYRKVPYKKQAYSGARKFSPRLRLVLKQSTFPFPQIDIIGAMVIGG